MKVALYGPFPTRGRHHLRRDARLDGDGAWRTGTARTRTAPFRIARVGYYTYRESIAETPQHAAFEGKCGETSETTLARRRRR